MNNGLVVHMRLMERGNGLRGFLWRLAVLGWCVAFIRHVEASRFSLDTYTCHGALELQKFTLVL